MPVCTRQFNRYQVVDPLLAAERFGEQEQQRDHTSQHVDRMQPTITYRNENETFFCNVILCPELLETQRPQGDKRTPSTSVAASKRRYFSMALFPEGPCCRKMVTLLSTDHPGAVPE